MNKYIEVVLPKEAEDLKVYYQKVLEREDFDVTEVEEILQQDITYDNEIDTENKDVVQITNLEEGIYQIHISGNEEYEFAPMLVSMPAWTEDGERLLHQVSVTPKYTKVVKPEPEPEQTVITETPIIQSPKTGDGAPSTVFGVLGMISFIIVVIMTCHNRFKCARMSE